MDYCKYHPLAPATYACPQCQSSQCDSCVDEGGYNAIERCFLCGAEVDSFGSANAVEPFWRRLPQSFRYPMNRETLMLIIGISLLSTLFSSYGSLITFFLWVAVTGVMIKYSFLCLQHTADGLLVAPGTSDAFQGGVSLILNIIGMMIVMSGMVYLSGRYLGDGVATALSLLFIIGLPAALINYAVTEEFSEAVNPLSMLRLMGIIGLPYGLLLAFLMIMSASVGLISGVIGDNFSILSAALQSVVFYYYMVVTFHIMGYLIFQNQEGLGFVARGHHGEGKEVRPELERMRVHIDILVKEGQYEAAITRFKEALKQYPDDKALNFTCFELLYASKNRAEMAQFAPRFFLFLSRHNRLDQLYPSYRKLLRLDSTYLPATAELRVLLANACQQAGNPRLAVKLLAGLHREFPDYEGLADAYRLLAECLEALPNMDEKVAQCRQLAARFEKIAASIARTPADGDNAGGESRRDEASALTLD